MNDLLNKIYLTKQYAIILVVALLITVGWFFTLHQSNVAELAELNTEISTVEARINQAKTVIGDVEDIRQQIDRLQEMRETLASSVRKQDEISELVDKIISVGEEVGLNFTSINLEANKLFSAREKNADYIKVTMNLNAKAEFFEFGHFLDRVNKLPFILSLEQVIMHYKKELYPELEVSNRILLILK